MKAKTKAKAKAKDITKKILYGLGVTALVDSVLIFPGLAYVIQWVEKEARTSRLQARETLYRLKYRGIVKIVLKKNKVWLKLTPKGKKLLAKHQVEDLKIPKPKKWDGLWRLVMFDVPEQQRNTRDLVRRKLGQLGFVALQKSVLVHPYPCTDAVDMIKNHYDLPPGQLYVFDAKVKEGERLLKRHFHL